MLATQTALSFSDAERSLGERLLKIAAETDRIEGYREPHATEIARLSEKLGQRLGLHGHDLSALKFAALAHDLGERSMKRDYLLRPGGLTWEEQLDLWRHPIIGEQEAAELKLPRLTQLLIRWHHEWWNGQGYPDGLSGTAIPLGARVLRIVDTYCALVANRPHRGKLEMPVIEQFVADQAGVEADPQVVKEFLALLAEERPVSVPFEATPDFAAPQHDTYATAPPEVEASEDGQEIEADIPAPPSISVGDVARQESSPSSFGWQELSPMEVQQSSPTTQDVPALREEETPLNASSEESDVAPLPVTPTAEPVLLEPVGEPFAEFQVEPSAVTLIDLPTEPLAEPERSTQSNEPQAELEQPTEPSAPLAVEPSIVSLSDAPDHFWPVAQWLYEQWWALPGSTINVVSDQLKEHLAGQPVPSTLVAVLADQPVGSISLQEYANVERPDLTPCLAALYVRPEFRQQGIASRLLAAAESQLRAMGVTRMYFTTPEYTDFFAKRGWQVLEPAMGAQTLRILVKE